MHIKLNDSDTEAMRASFYECMEDVVKDKAFITFFPALDGNGNP